MEQTPTRDERNEPSTLDLSRAQPLLSTETPIIEEVKTVTNPESTKGMSHSFNGFSRLPPELRLKIWKEAMPGPRVVELLWCETANSWFCPVDSTHKRCTLLEVCKESRDLYLCDWVPIAALLEDEAGPVSSPRSRDLPRLLSRLTAGKSIPMAHFNSKIDTVYIDVFVEDNIQSIGAGLAMIAGLRRLAFGFNGLYLEGAGCIQDFVNLICGLEYLETIINIGNDAYYFCFFTMDYLPCKKLYKGFIEFGAKNSRSRSFNILVSKKCLERNINLEYLDIYRGGRYMENLGSMIPRP